MSRTASYRPGVLKTDVTLANGGTRVLPPNVNLPALDWTNCSCMVGGCFTPSDTTVTINPTGTDAISITNGTFREYVAIGSTALAAAKFMVLGARRKPGTTGTISAQTITFAINSVTLATIKVAAAAASADPGVGYNILAIPDEASDTRFDITTNNIVIGCTAADSDLEIFFLIIGDD